MYNNVIPLMEVHQFFTSIKEKKLKKDIFKRNVYLFGCHSFFQKVSPFCFLPANYPRVLLELFHD